MPHFGLEELAPYIMYYSGVISFLLAIFWRPDIGLYYLLPLIPVQTVRYWMNPFPLGSSVVDLMILAIILGCVRKGYPLIPKTPVTKLLVYLVFYSYVSCWLGAFFLGSDLPFFFDNERLIDWKNYITLPIVFWLSFSAFRQPYQMKLAMAAMGFSVLMLNRSFFDGIAGKDMSTFSEGNRVEGAMGYAGVNGLAAFEAHLICALLGMTMYARNWGVKLLYLSYAGFSLYCLMFAFSRGGYVGFLAGWVFLGVVRKKWLLVALGFFVLTWQQIVPPAVVQRVTMTTNSDGQLEHSAELRMGLWDEAMEVFRGNPATGTGMFTYAYRGGAFRNPHNYYVQVLVEGGLIGIGFFVILLWKLYRMGMALANADTSPYLRGLGLGLGAWVAAAAATNFFGDRWTYFQVNGYMWVLAGMVARGLEIFKDEQEELAVENEERGREYLMEEEEDGDFEALPEVI